MIFYMVFRHSPGNALVELAVLCSSLLLYPTHSGSLIAITLIVHGPSLIYHFLELSLFF